VPEVRIALVAGFVAGLAACLAAGAARAGGDAQRGESLSEARCGGCHSVDADRVGPRHAGVVGRRAGSVPGFAYSEALRRSGITWDAAMLDRWLTDPEALVPGQGMGYRLDDPQERADVVAYLATLRAR
jgi:cytochrome c